MKKLSDSQKGQGAKLATKSLMRALESSMYPSQEAEAIFGIKMQDQNPDEVKDMATGGIVFNVWIGLYINQMVNNQWVEKALLDGDLPKQFQNKVNELMKIALQKKSYPGQYMPELIRRGFDKIVWNKEFHNAVKLK